MFWKSFNQRRSQEFTKGGQTRECGVSGVQGQNMETLKHNGAVTKN